MTRVIVNSIPKSGTHLVERALTLLGVSRERPLFLSSATAAEYPPDGGETVPVGVGMSVPVSADLLRQRLASLPVGRVVTAHVPHSPGLERLLCDLLFRMVLIVRDPRDVAVSLAHHIARERTHRLHSLFADISPEDRILLAINGCDRLENIAERFASVLPWITRDRCLLVRFEELVGPQGGGSDDSQQASLSAICAHLQLPQPGDDVAPQLFGTGATFRKGTIGQWQEQFTPAHHQAFAALAGGLLDQLGYR